MRRSLTRVVVPVVGLLAVTTALALVGIAPILLFPLSKEAGPRPIAPAASSEVASVAAPPPRGNGGSAPTSPAQSPNEPGATSPARDAPTAGPNLAEGGGPVSQPEQPDVDQPDKFARQGDGSVDEGPDQRKPDEDKDQGKPDKGQGKEKTKNGKALGHSKDKANGKAKGHGKWQGRASVAFPPRAAKPGHVHPSSVPEYSGRGDRPHARPRS